MAKEKVVIKKTQCYPRLREPSISFVRIKLELFTQDEIVLEYPLDIHGDLDMAVLRRAYLNSHFQTGLKNLMDRAIISRTEKEAKEHVILTKIQIPVFKNWRASIWLWAQTYECYR